MEQNNTLSVVIITLNEERNIGRCIKSVKDLADEIIVVDSFSTDKTKEICLHNGVRFETADWRGYAETKNYANSLAKGDYVLSLDADEAVSENLKENLLVHKFKGFDAMAYKLNRLTNYCGKFIYYCGWYPDQKIRLWKRGAGKWEGLIHEEFKFKEEGKVLALKGDLLHYSYYSFNEHLEQMIKFTDLMALDLIKEKKSISWFKIVFSPGVKFLRSYLFQGGFRDGFYGFVICVLSSVATFLKYSKAKQIKNQEGK